MIIHKEISESNEFYLYMNGELIYKKWLDTGVSKVFDIMAYDKYTHSSYTDLDIKDSPFIIKVKAKFRFLTEEEGGRKTPVFNRYRPNHVFEYDNAGNLIEAFMGEVLLDNHDKLDLGLTHVGEIRFLFTNRLEKYLEKGRKWWICEANYLVGHGEILEFKK
ncbi:MAG: hypothetical protein ACRBG0_24605 [Lewinella sp.]|uniref:hypothetical protein n=1 Tax=Lewinella sp. TaxID=2004506 RepID=UPI003D6A3624